MAVEVILREDVPNLGAIGEIVRVRPGYARNYLYPRGLAVEANRKNVAELDHQKRVIGAKAERDRKAAEGAAAKLEGISVTVHARAGEEGKGFAVVAMEVRNLAEQSREATEQVREILSEIQYATNAAVMATEEGIKGVDSGQALNCLRARRSCRWNANSSCPGSRPMSAVLSPSPSTAIAFWSRSHRPPRNPPRPCAASSSPASTRSTC